MNVLKRAYLYDTRKKGKSLTLFLLFMLITTFVTTSFGLLSATQAAAANLRETIGASFTLRGKPVEFSAIEENFSMQFIPISQQDIDLIADNTEIKAYCSATRFLRNSDRINEKKYTHSWKYFRAHSLAPTAPSQGERPE